MHHRPSRLRYHFVLLVLLGAVLGGAGPAAAQAPLTLVNRETQVQDIAFQFLDTQTFEPSALRLQIALTELPSLAGLRRRLSFIPLVPEVGVHPFSPVELARDAVRIERFYQRNGFLHPEVDWLVRLDSAKNTVRVLFTILEGPPLILQNLDFEGPDGRAAFYQFPEELAEDWTAFRDDIALETGRRLGEFDIVQLETRALGWVRDQGYAFARVRAETQIDSVANAADVTLHVDAGPRTRIERIVVEGNESVGDGVVRRELPFREGDRFSQSKLVEGQREVFSLNLFQIALADVPEAQPRDSTVVVRLRVREGEPRVLTLTAGYFTEGGLSTQAQWQHRNFFGGARTFTASALANTGFGAVVANPDRRYRGSVALRQPYFFHRRLSATVSPFAEYRDDVIEESWQAGADGTVLYEADQLHTASATYTFASRRLLDPRTSVIASGLFTLADDALRDAIGRQLDRSALALSVTYGDLDDPIVPRRGYVLRPAADVTLPFPSTSVEYFRLGGSAVGYFPLGPRMDLFARVIGGRLFPFGRSLPGAGPLDPLVEFFRLRDVVYIGGGTADVRGWGNGLLGPKFPDVYEREEEDGSITTTADRYVPVGAFNKLAGTVEARLPFPFLGPSFGTFVFLDAGRVWTDHRRFDFEDEAFAAAFEGLDAEDERIFYAAGGGIEFATPVGALRLAAGFKLNPNYFDLRDPSAVAGALAPLLDDAPDSPAEFEQVRAALRDIDPKPLKRLHLHLSIGQTF